MQRIDKFLVHARQQAKDMEYIEMKRALERMTTEQLHELTADNISDYRFYQIFDSVGALYLVKG